MEEDIYGFVVLNYNTGNDVIQCVNSIIDNCLHKKMIIVVDNCSTDNSFNYMNDIFSKSTKYLDVKCIRTKRNGGYGYGNNFGINELKNHKIKRSIISNSDIIFLEKSIEILFENLNRNEKAVICSPLVCDKNADPQTLPWKKTQSLFQYLGLKYAKNLIYTFNELEENNPKEVYMSSGCCYAIDIAKFKKMNCFDENIFLYNEEGIIAKCVLKNDYIILFDINAKVIHNHGSSTGNSNMLVDLNIIMSGLYYWKVYEKVSVLKLLFIWLYFLLKIFIKNVLGKYKEKTEYWKIVQTTWIRLIQVIKL